MSKKAISLHAISGFLGQGRDWSAVIPIEISFTTSDFFSPNSRMSAQKQALDLVSLARAVNQEARSFVGPRVLLGYSLGGRVALNCLEQSIEANPGLRFWDAAVLVSTNPGLSRSEDREARFRSDQVWAKRFLEEDWEKLMNAWNSQPVFQARTEGSELPLSLEAMRLEKSFSREKLAQVLLQSSLGKQKDFRSFLKQIQIPILWISGTEDAKFRELAEEMATLNSKFKTLSVSGAGHRVPWEKPEVFGEAVKQFLTEV
jgi:2-succinyl-6-hydroxy-2,4-cyclohexadiene-1-carboxylate synthase